MKPVYNIIKVLIGFYCILVTMSLILVAAINYGRPISWDFLFQYMVPPCIVIAGFISLYLENTRLKEELKLKK